MIDGATREAAATIIDIMRSPGRNSIARLHAAVEVLSRAGVGKAVSGDSGVRTIQLVVVQAGAPQFEPSSKVLDITHYVRR